MPEIIVIGGGGHAKVVISTLKKYKKYNILGYTDAVDRGPLLEVPYLGSDDVLLEYPNKFQSKALILGLGAISIENLHKRRSLQNEMNKLGYKIASVVSSNAIVNEDVLIGEGSFIADGVVINSGTSIGKGAIINTNSSIDHDCKIGDFVHVAPGTTLSGGVTIGEFCMIGAGSTIIQSVNISNNILVGAGAVVVNNLSVQGTYLGIPAKILV